MHVQKKYTPNNLSFRHILATAVQSSTVIFLERDQNCLLRDFPSYTLVKAGARGGAVGWGTALQVGRSQVRFPMVHCRTVALGSTQPLTEMSTRNISWEGKGGQCVGLTTLPPSCVDCLEILEHQPPWKPQGPLQACSGIALHFHSGKSTVWVSPIYKMSHVVRIWELSLTSFGLEEATHCASIFRTQFRNRYKRTEQKIAICLIEEEDLCTYFLMFIYWNMSLFTFPFFNTCSVSQIKYWYKIQRQIHIRRNVYRGQTRYKEYRNYSQHERDSQARIYTWSMMHITERSM